MKGWLLCQYSDEELKDRPHTVYKIDRYLEEASKLKIPLAIYRPEILTMIVADENKIVKNDGQIIPLPDFVISVGITKNYYGLAIIRHLKNLGVKCLNQAEAIMIASDKLLSHQVLADNNLPIPKTMFAKFPINVDFVKREFGFPVVIKTIEGALGKGVYLCNSKSDFTEIIDLLEAADIQRNIIVQEYIKTSRGRDLRVIVIGNRVAAVMERNAQKGAFKANFSQGGSVKAYTSNAEIERIALKSAKLIGLDIAGIDLLFDASGFKIAEVNSNPGFVGLEKSCDINFPEEVFKFIKQSLDN